MGKEKKERSHRNSGGFRVVIPRNSTGVVRNGRLEKLESKESHTREKEVAYAESK